MQYLDPNARDETAISYEEKLEKYLSSVLVGDDLAQKVRAAFDAYVFLSYRKKDRRYAQELMRLIHENEFCRDIAIWYDEFLIPGEVFSDSCDKQIRNCDLFIAVLSENYLDSYGGRYELPTAIKERKQILLVVIGETPIPQYLMRYQWIRLPQLPLPGDFRRVTECIEAMALDSIHNNHY